MFYSQGIIYYICFVSFFILSFLFLFYAIKNSKKEIDYQKKLSPIKYLWISLVVLEVIKIFLLIGDNQGLKPLRYPIVFCSIVMYSYPVFCLKKNSFSDLAMGVSIIPSVISALAFLIYPVNLLQDSILDYFITIHSFYFHFVILVVPIYLIASKTYKFEFKKFYGVATLISCYVLLATIISIYIGADISLFGPNSSYLGFLYKVCGYIPGNILVMVFSYILSIIVYFLASIKKSASK